MLFDIDNGYNTAWGDQGDVDTWLNIFDSNEQLIGRNDDGRVLDPGSSSGLDSRLVLSLASGWYYAAVGQYENQPFATTVAPYCGTPPPTVNYTLHISTDVPTSVPLPAAAPLMLSGLGVAGAFMRRRKAASSKA